MNALTLELNAPNTVNAVIVEIHDLFLVLILLALISIYTNILSIQEDCLFIMKLLSYFGLCIEEKCG